MTRQNIEQAQWTAGELIRASESIVKVNDASAKAHMRSGVDPLKSIAVPYWMRVITDARLRYRPTGDAERDSAITSAMDAATLKYFRKFLMSTELREPTIQEYHAMRWRAHGEVRVRAAKNPHSDIHQIGLRAIDSGKKDLGVEGHQMNIEVNRYMFAWEYPEFVAAAGYMLDRGVYYRSITDLLNKEIDIALATSILCP